MRRIRNWVSLKDIFIFSAVIFFLLTNSCGLLKNKYELKLGKSTKISIYGGSVEIILRDSDSANKYEVGIKNNSSQRILLPDELYSLYEVGDDNISILLNLRLSYETIKSNFSIGKSSFISRIPFIAIEKERVLGRGQSNAFIFEKKEKSKVIVVVGQITVE